MMRTGVETERPIAGPGLSIEDLTVVTIALERLNPIERTVLTLMFYDGLSHRDIACRLHRPLGTIKTWMRTGLRHLREQIIPAVAPASVRARPVSFDKVLCSKRRLSRNSPQPRFPTRTAHSWFITGRLTGFWGSRASKLIFQQLLRPLWSLSARSIPCS